jgi:hypothetical protein
MDLRERADDHEEAIRTALDGRQAKMWTALPGIIQSFDATKQTAVVQTTIQAKQSKPDPANPGQVITTLVNLPLCQDCPVHFPTGGGATLTFPVKKGDECLVVFASRAIDGWWQNGGIQAPVEARMHALSDGHAFVGISSVPNVISDISTTETQLRSDDGSTSISLNPTAQTLALVAPGGVTINGNVAIAGTLAASDTISSETGLSVDGTAITVP